MSSLCKCTNYFEVYGGRVRLIAWDNWLCKEIVEDHSMYKEKPARIPKITPTARLRRTHRNTSIVANVSVAF